MRLPRTRFTSRQLMGLILASAVFLGLIFSPLGPLAVAVAIILPGFVIERSRGGTGIIGGTVSTASFVVGFAMVTGVGSLVAGTSTPEEFLQSFPAIYFLFVVALLWGGAASITLYWVIQAWRERGRKAPAVRLRRLQFKLRQLMVLVLVCAVVFALLTTPAVVLVVAVGIVIPGFLIDRLRGYSGVVGGMVSAALAPMGLGIAVYTYDFFTATNSNLADYLGPPAITLPMIGVAGLAWGALVSTMLDVSILVAKSYSNAKPLRDDPASERSTF